MKIIALAALFFLEPGKIYIQQFHISTQHSVGDLKFKGVFGVGKGQTKNNRL